MKRSILTLLAVLALSMCFAGAQPAQKKDKKVKFQGPFVENFSKGTSKFFGFNPKRGYDSRYYPGIPSFTEEGTDVLALRIEANGPVGAGRGPEIVSKNMTYYGTYSARIRVPDVKDVQPNVGSVVGYFTYNKDPEEGLSEIDWEWLLADPEIVYIGTWTGLDGKYQRAGRAINLAEGTIINTVYRSAAKDNIERPLTGAQCQPETVPAIEGFNASKNFYVYGFDWYPDRLTWWILHPVTNEKIVLWDFTGPTPDFSGIPDDPTYYRLNFWHTNNWAVETNPESLENPKYPYALEVDWMKYTPYKDIR